MTKRAVLYARVSYDDKSLSGGRNLEGQIGDGRAYCQEKGYQVVAELAEDDRGASGASWDLPKLNEAFDLAFEGRFDVLVVRELDRLARNLAKQLAVEKDFKQYGVEIAYILGDYPDTSEGRLNKHIKATIAEYEREQIALRLIRGRRNAVKKGKVLLHGVKHPPFGYRLEDGALIVYEPEAPIVKLIFTWYVYGDETGKKLSMHTIAQKLTGMEVPTWADVHGVFKKKQGCGVWQPSAIGRILANEIYKGVWHYGKRGNAREHWLAVDVPSIVSTEVWKVAQEQRERNARQSKRNTKYDFLMGRRVVCGACHANMVGRSRQKGRFLYYSCPGYKRVESCSQTDFFRADHVDNTIWQWLKGLLLDPEHLREELERHRENLQETLRPLRRRGKVIDELLTENRAKIGQLIDLYLSSSNFTKEVLTEKQAHLEKLTRDLEAERVTNIALMRGMDYDASKIKSVEDIARRMAGDIEQADVSFDARRQLIDDLGVQATLMVENGQKVARVRCVIRESESLPIGPDNIILQWLTIRLSDKVYEDN